MNTRNLRRKCAALLLLVVLGGCGQGANEDAGTTAEREVRGDAATGERTHGAEGTGTAVAPGATAAEIRAQLQERRLALETAILEGRLAEVHDLAFAVRDLVIALHEKAGTIAGVKHEEIDAKIAELRASAGKLDEYGDAGNLTGTEAEFVKFNTVVSAIDAATPR